MKDLEIRKDWTVQRVQGNSQDLLKGWLESRVRWVRLESRVRWVRPWELEVLDAGLAVEERGQGEATELRN